MSKICIDGKKRSSFSLWLAKCILCPLFGHKWSWWQVIERSKCDRCLALNLEDVKEFEASAAFHFKRMENEYRKLQTPFWILSGQKMTPEEKVVALWMKERNMDYYDLQRLRDVRGGAHYKKDLSIYTRPLPKNQEVKYEKRSPI